jgi:hypothetical protein
VSVGNFEISLKLLTLEIVKQIRFIFKIRTFTNKKKSSVNRLYIPCRMIILKRLTIFPTVRLCLQELSDVTAADTAA